MIRLTIFLLVFVTSFAMANPYSVSDRGLVAVPHSDGGVHLSWRLFKEDSQSAAFNVYRVTPTGALKLNRELVTQGTNFTDMTGSLASGDDWYVEEVITSKRSRLALKPRNPEAQYLEFATGQTIHGRNFATGDLLGRGQLDFVLRHSSETVDPYYSNWRSSNSTYYLVAFDQDGNHLWSYDMGWAIEEGMWYSPYLVYDLDGDGKAELVVKAGDDSMPKDKMRDVSGRVMYGPEYLRVVSGEDGKTVLAQTAWPSRTGFMSAASREKDLANGRYEEYNQWSRNFLAIAYLDGKNPHVIVSRGTYGKHKVSAYRYQNGALQRVWSWENENPADGGVPNHWGQGAHSLQANDVDGDGRDEVVLGALVLDDDGTVLYAASHNHREHLDHVYIGDIDPARPGKEFYYGAEGGHKIGGIGLRDAATGEQLWSVDWPTSHIHSQGICADLLAASPGIECYSGEADQLSQWMFSATGEVLDTNKLPTLSPLAAWWDGDLQKELLEEESAPEGDVYMRLSNFPERDHAFRLQAPMDRYKEKDLNSLRVLAVFDLFGDWREEVVVADRTRLLVYTTNVAAERRAPWLMSDRTYRLGVTGSSVGYYQQPMLDLNLAAVPQYKRPGPFPAVSSPASTAPSSIPSPAVDPMPASVANEVVSEPDVQQELAVVPVVTHDPRSMYGEEVGPAPGVTTKTAKSSGSVDVLWLLFGSALLALGRRRLRGARS